MNNTTNTQTITLQTIKYQLQNTKTHTKNTTSTHLQSIQTNHQSYQQTVSVTVGMDCSRNYCDENRIANSRIQPVQ